MQRVVLHLDMDAFYAAVEVREDPELAGRPLIIGHRGRRGVVATCSYEARAFGVRSAMPSLTAERLCPDAIWLPGRMELYVEVSRRIRRLLDDAAPVVEPLSIDEAFLDLTGHAAGLAEGAALARALKDRIRAQERLTASVGVAPNKFLAKLASDMEKPDGLVVFPIEDVPTRLWPLPVRRLWGVGPKSAEKLERGGIRTVGDIARAPESALVPLVGPALAAHVHRLAHGEDRRPVERGLEAKSISEERTYVEDLTDRDEIDRALLARARGVARELRRQGLAARTIHIKVRTGDFTTATRALTLPDPTDLADTILDAARALFRERIDLQGRGVRLLGVGVSGILPAESAPAPLFPDAVAERSRRLARAEDAVSDRLGTRALTRARLLRRD
ncbi:MAG TPA: DNA polymerase IV [Candidatus Polarisedimenticolaceae bacterium]|nr:DNA polymerase IV [Candidatus Polarisedimenticolaceae bacterium]